MNIPKLTFVLALAVPAVFNTACHEAPVDLLGPDAPSAAKPDHAGGGKGGSDDGSNDSELVADLVTGDYFTTAGTPWLSVGAAATASSGAVLFHHTRCGDVTPEGSGYALTDETRLEIRTKGRSITAVRFWGQDLIGDEGVAHETDWIPMDVPKNAITDGYVLHVHADNVEVWRLSGHLTGSRVEMIGTISIGDVTYYAGTPADCTGG